MQGKPGWNVYYIHGYDVIYAEFRTLQLRNFMKFDQNAKKNPCLRFYLNKINNML